MFLSKAYVVTATDKFNAHDYPEVINELIGIKEKLTGSSQESVGMIISFFKDHSIMRSLANEHPHVFGLVSRGSLSGQHIEMLFVSCRTNKVFLDDFETFIKTVVTSHTAI